MECLIDLDPDHRVLRTTVITKVLTNEVLTEMYQLVELISFQGGPYSAITDLSQVERFPISAKTIRTLAASKPAIAAGTPRVIVAKQDIAFGLSRMFELSRNSMEGQLHVVRSLDEAYNLLGVKPEDFSQRLFPERSAA
jgi:hypothetical protein